MTWDRPPSDKTPWKHLEKVDTEQAMLEREAELLAHEDTECEKLMEIYEHLKELHDKVEMRAS